MGRFEETCSRDSCPSSQRIFLAGEMVSCCILTSFISKQKKILFFATFLSLDAIYVHSATSYKCEQVCLYFYCTFILKRYFQFALKQYFFNWKYSWTYQIVMLQSWGFQNRISSNGSILVTTFDEDFSMLLKRFTAASWKWLGQKLIIINVWNLTKQFNTSLFGKSLLLW